MASVSVELAWEAGQAEVRPGRGASALPESHEAAYIVRGASDEYAAAAAAFDAAPAEWHGIARRTVSISERLGPDAWKAAVRYERAARSSSKSGDPDDAADVRWSFSSSGATRHVETPLSTVKVVKNPRVQDEVKHPGVIEPDEDGRPRGVDIPVPMLRVSATRTVRDAAMTQAAKLRLAELVGSINLREFHGFRPGELRYDGAEFSDREDEDGRTVWDVTLNFMYQPTQFNIDCGDGVVVPAKAGWDYLWKQIETAVSNGKTYRRVYAAFVDRLYPVNDFGRLLP